MFPATKGWLTNMHLDLMDIGQDMRRLKWLYTGCYWSADIDLQANFFYRLSAELSLSEKYFDSARKRCYANLQNCFARLTPPN